MYFQLNPETHSLILAALHSSPSRHVRCIGGAFGVHGAAAATAGVHVRHRRFAAGCGEWHVARGRGDDQGVSRRPAGRRTDHGKVK